MTTSTAPLDEAPAAEPRLAPARGRWPGQAAVLVAAALGLGMAWSGGLAGLAGVALGGAAVYAAARRAAPATAPAPGSPGSSPTQTATQAHAPASATPRATGGTTAGSASGTAAMVEHVVPVWSRQIDATRVTADEGLSGLLTSFSDMSSSFDTLLGSLGSMSAAAGPGAVEHAVGRSAPELAALLAPSTRAFAERDAAVAELAHCGQAVAQLDVLARQAREIARQTRLIAFNASIEANRQSGAGSGHQAVAQEMRTMATRIGETGDAMGRILAALGERLDDTRRAAEVRDTTPQELQIELEIRAREALEAMLATIGTSLQASGAVREASTRLRSQLDEVFVQFQFGDRVSQMLSIIGNDMNHFAQWVVQNPQAGAGDAAAWLDRLEASYTMDEQRSEHHGNVHIDRGSAVDFF